MILLIKLFLAHLIGDFVLQPSSWIKSKEEKKLLSSRLYLHTIIHLVLIMVVVWDWSFLWWAIILSVSHLAIDVFKLYVSNGKNIRILFFVDQGLHFVSIYLIWLWYNKYAINFEVFSYPHNILLITSVLFLSSPVSIAIKNFIKKWKPEGLSSLDDAGKYIGIIERILVFIFLFSDNWEAVGFLLAAKSIFRFGDLKESNDLKLTEYVLIGTLLSFGVAISVSLLYKYLYQYLSLGL